MPTVMQTIQRLLPKGTNPLPEGNAPSWQTVPLWPPDLFAVTATLVEGSGCYTHPRYIDFSSNAFFNQDYKERVEKAARSWKKDSLEELQKAIQPLWTVLLEECAKDLAPNNPSRWWDASLTLLAIADSASFSAGFLPLLDSAKYYDCAKKIINDFATISRIPKTSPRPEECLPYLPNSLCWMVPPEEACVQPKAITCQVGCTLRSLSHHLALLRPMGEVATHWHISSSQNVVDTKGSQAIPFNLLLVPFPYQIEGSCFQRGKNCIEGRRFNFFSIEQKWLAEVESSDIASFLLKLVKIARREVGAVHGIVLPELALNTPVATLVLEHVREVHELELFIAGVTSQVGNLVDSGRDPNPVNGVFARILDRGKVSDAWVQPKHHRWKLDQGQIRRYHLGSHLQPTVEWWEEIDISERSCQFGVFRPNGVFTALVCEDLARIDPVQAVLRAVGPNLVFVLLMDGPQRKDRWSSRYATNLADDPGCGVLTLTSLGMIQRSVDPGEPEPLQVGLWKDYRGEPKELLLPKGSHALVLTLSPIWEKEYTLDTRSDCGVIATEQPPGFGERGTGNTVKFTLAGIRPLTHPDPGKIVGK